MQAVREQVRPDHRQYLRNPINHKVKVMLGGSTLSNDQSQMNGTLLVVEASSQDEVHAFVRDDPYSAVSLFERIEIRPWAWGLGVPGGTR